MLTSHWSITTLPHTSTRGRTNVTQTVVGLRALLPFAELLQSEASLHCFPIPNL